MNLKSKEITVLEINPKYKRKGYGSILMKEIPEAKSVYTEVENDSAIRFYKKFNFKDSGIRKSFSSEKPNKQWLKMMR